jgi:hypothetical protein
MFFHVSLFNVAIELPLRFVAPLTLIAFMAFGFADFGNSKTLRMGQMNWGILWLN